MLNQKKTSDKKNLGNLGYYENIKSNSNQNKWRIQVQGPKNYFNKIIVENFANLKKVVPFKIDKAHKCQTK